MILLETQTERGVLLTLDPSAFISRVLAKKPLKNAYTECVTGSGRAGIFASVLYVACLRSRSVTPFVEIEFFTEVEGCAYGRETEPVKKFGLASSQPHRSGLLSLVYTTAGGRGAMVFYLFDVQRRTHVTSLVLA